MKIVITQEDAKKSNNFTDIHDCALAKVMKKALKIKNIQVGTFRIINTDTGKEGKINPPFQDEDHRNLISGEIKEFVTEYTPI